MIFLNIVHYCKFYLETEILMIPCLFCTNNNMQEFGFAAIYEEILHLENAALLLTFIHFLTMT